MNTLQDIKLGFRRLRGSPGVTAVVIVALALGVASATTVFSIVNAALLRPLPFPEPDRLVMIYEDRGQEQRRRMGAADFVEVRRLSRSFETVAAVDNTSFSITSSERPLGPLMQRVSPGYFRLLRIEPLLGQTLLPAEGVAGGPQMAVLSHAFWQKHFGGDPGVLGRAIELDYQPYEIVGVMPEGFHNPFFPRDPALWLPLVPQPEELARGPEHPGGRSSGAGWARRTSSRSGA